MRRFAVFSTRKAPNGETISIRIGSAVENRDASLSLYLDALPVNGEAQIRSENADCVWCQRLGVASSTADAAHRAGHPERSRAEGGD